MRKQSSVTFRDGDKVITTTTTTESLPAEIQFADILAAVEIQPDNDMGAPWENADSFDHTATPARDMPDECEADAMRGNFWSDGERERLVIQVKNPESWGIVEYARAGGASRQVARELLAMSVRKTIDLIQGWYNDFDTWAVSCDFMGEADSICGCTGYDYASTEFAEEVASIVAAALEKRGFTIIGSPTHEKLIGLKHGRKMTVKGWREEYKRNLNSQNIVE